MDERIIIACIAAVTVISIVQVWWNSRALGVIAKLTGASNRTIERERRDHLDYARRKEELATVSQDVQLAARVAATHGQERMQRAALETQLDIVENRPPRKPPATTMTASDITPPTAVDADAESYNG